MTAAQRDATVPAMATRPRTLPRYIYVIPSRHGTPRLYFWRAPGQARVRLHEPSGSPEFHARYADLLMQCRVGPIAPKRRTHPLTPAAGTLGALALTYMASGAFHDYDAATIRKRRHLIETMLVEPIAPGADDLFRDFPLARLTSDALDVLRERATLRGTLGQANERVKALRALFKWARDPARGPSRLMGPDPSAGLRVVRQKSEGWHTWTLAEIDQFEARHPPGTRANLALQALLYTGARRSDVIRLGRPHVRGAGLRWTAHKGRNQHPIVIEIDILPPLAEALVRGPVGEVTWLVTEYGQPFTHAGFGNWFRARCQEAGLPHCSAHGLRKAGATRAAENGATAHMLMAMFGWSTLQQAERYTRAAERRRLASAGMSMLLRLPGR